MGLYTQSIGLFWPGIPSGNAILSGEIDNVGNRAILTKQNLTRS